MQMRNTDHLGPIRAETGWASTNQIPLRSPDVSLTCGANFTGSRSTGVTRAADKGINSAALTSWRSADL